MKDIISGKYLLDTDYKMSMKLFNANYGILAYDTILDQHLITRPSNYTRVNIHRFQVLCTFVRHNSRRFIYIISALGFYFFKFLSCALDQKICHKLDCFHLKENLYSTIHKFMYVRDLNLGSTKGTVPSICSSVRFSKISWSSAFWRQKKYIYHENKVATVGTTSLLLLK